MKLADNEPEQPELILRNDSLRSALQSTYFEIYTKMGSIRGCLALLIKAIDQKESIALLTSMQQLLVFSNSGSQEAF